MEESEEFGFVAQLGKELNSGEIALPSLPDVVLKIRALLEREECDFDQVSQAVRSDPVLVSRLMLFANSAYHNPGGAPVQSLDVAIGRLGFEAIRNAALSLAVKQLLLGEEYKKIAQHLRQVWSRSIQLACMCYATARNNGELSEETAFMSGLLNEIGKLYILMKSQDFPSFLQNEEVLAHVLETWYSPISKSIVEAWGFEEEVCQSTNPVDYLSERPSDAATLVDVVYAARLLLDKPGDDSIDFSTVLSCEKLNVSDEKIPEILARYQKKLQSVRQSLSAAA